MYQNFFPNGMRIGSSIAENKFRKAYIEITGKEVSSDIYETMKKIGYVYSDKIYLLSPKKIECIKELVSDAVSTGNYIIYYENFYNIHIKSCNEAGVFTHELIEQIFRKIFKKYSFYKSYMKVSPDIDFYNMIELAFGDDTELDLSEITRRLPFVDEKKINDVC